MKDFFIYRRDIDGLRAIAVLPVIFFHAGFEIFNGGFIGVDIFFIISGYLITSLILKDLESNSFSLLKFYERRIRRIVPLLFFVALICIPFAWLWMSPKQFIDFSQSIASLSILPAVVLTFILCRFLSKVSVAPSNTPFIDKLVLKRSV